MTRQVEACFVPLLASLSAPASSMASFGALLRHLHQASCYEHKATHPQDELQVTSERRLQRAFCAMKQNHIMFCLLSVQVLGAHPSPSFPSRGQSGQSLGPPQAQLHLLLVPLHLL